jgi:hypothetical protein
MNQYLSLEVNSIEDDNLDYEIDEMELMLARKP